MKSEEIKRLVAKISVWRAMCAMKEVGLLVREGGDKGGKWIVKKAGCQDDSLYNLLKHFGIEPAHATIRI